MFKKIFNIYKTQLFVSLTLTIVLVSTSVLRTPTSILLTFVGTMLGTFLLDLDYLIYAYFLEPEKGFSKSLRGFVEHKDWKGALDHVFFNNSEVEDKTLNSVIFQILLAGLALFAVSAATGLFLKAVIISVFANSIYRMADYYFDGKSKEWFWALKKTPTENGILTYGLILVIVLVYSITLF